MAKNRLKSARIRVLQRGAAPWKNTPANRRRRYWGADGGVADGKRSLQRHVRNLGQRLEKVQVERDLYANLNNIAPFGYFICNRKGRILDANQTGIRMLGMWKRELLTLSFSDCVVYEDLPVLGQACFDLYETGKPQTCELRLTQKNGAVFWAKLECMLEGKTVGPYSSEEVRLIVTDLSAIKRAQAALHYSEERYFTLLDLLPHGVNEVDLQGRIIYTNPAFAVMHGYERNELVGVHVWDILAREKDKKEQQDFFARARENQLQPGGSIRLKNRRKDGTTLDIQVDWSYKRGENGKPLGFVSVITDISGQVEVERITEAARLRLEEEVEKLTSALQDNNFELQGEADERKKAQRALEESEERFHSLAKSSTGILVVGHDREILYFNQRLADLWGLSAGALQDGADETGFLREMAGAMRNPRFFLEWAEEFYARPEVERRENFELADGRILECSSSPMHGAGKSGGRVWNARDITEIIAAEWALKIKDYAISSSVNAICFADLNGRITYVNRAFLDMWGIEGRKRVLGKDVFEIWENPAKGRAVWKIVLKKNFWRGQLTARHRDGSSFYVFLSANLLRDEHGTPVGLMGALVDISEQRKAQLALQESERRYRTIFEGSMDGICIVEKCPDKNCKKVIDCNESYARMAGLTKSELLALPCIREKQIILDSNSVPPGCCGKKEGTRKCQGNYSWRRTDGRENYIECRGTPIVVNGETFSLCVHRDYTRRRKAEEEIKNLSRQLLQVAEEERKRIARDLHDEFGQFLPALRYRLENFRDSLPKSWATQHGEFVKITTLIEKLGAMARNISHDLRPSLLDDFGLVPTIEASVAEYMERYEKMEVTFRVAGARKKIFPSLEIVLFRVFQEAMNNVAKHSRAKKVTVSLIFSYPAIILMVADDGIGFDPQPLDLKRARRERGGIGLLGMHERIASVDGKLTIRSGSGKGTLIRAEIFQKWKRTEDRFRLQNDFQCGRGVEEPGNH